MISKHNASCLAVLLALGGCRSDECVSRPAEAQIDVRVEGIVLSTIQETEVRLKINDAREFVRRFLVPAPSFVFEFKEWDRPPRTLAIHAVAFDSDSKAVAAGENRFAFRPDGCNSFVLTIAPGGLMDGGFDAPRDVGESEGPAVDTGPDSPQADGPTQDAAWSDTVQPDLLVSVSDVIKPDAIKPDTMPDTTPPADAAPPDTMPPDTLPPCTPGAKDCLGLIPRLCDGKGKWQEGKSCGVSCSAGVCTCTGAGLPGPAMVKVPKVGGGYYCVDSSEVTRDQYMPFSSRGSSGQPSYCAWNTTYVPFQTTSGQCSNGEWPPGTKGSHPVVCVDWCDARAFCAWAGKHLCTMVWGQWSDPSTSEWYNACSKGGSQTYPYPGATYKPHTCNGNEHGVVATVKVKSMSGCEGGYPGLFDLSGNVWEWTTACERSSGASDTCRSAGGAFYTSQPSMGCDSWPYGGFARNVVHSAIGFRCCADL